MPLWHCQAKNDKTEKRGVARVNKAYREENEKMTKEDLKEIGLTDEQIAKVIEDYGKNYVSKSQFNEKNEEAKRLKGEIETSRKEIDNLKKANKDNDELTAQIEQLKEDAKQRDKEYDAEMNALKVDSAIERALMGAHVKNTKAVKALLDLQDAKLSDDGTIRGLTEQLNAIKESDSYLFESESKQNGISGTTPGTGTAVANPTITKEAFNKMTYSERSALFNSDREAYDALSKGE